MAAAVALQVKRANGGAPLVLHDHIDQMAKTGTLLIEQTKTFIAYNWPPFAHQRINRLHPPIHHTLAGHPLIITIRSIRRRLHNTRPPLNPKETLLPGYQPSPATGQIALQGDDVSFDMKVVFFADDFAGAMQWTDDVTAPVRYGETIDSLCLIAIDNRPSVVCGIALDDDQKFHATLPESCFLPAARIPDV
ncbi:hypothetical protein NB04_12820 [Pseudomonas syringae pv. tomato]|nr:hypothetical protein NB04_12820 [Pseudomonas syringae pv. tomato]